MNTFEQIKYAIKHIDRTTVKPISSNMYDIRHSDGLFSTHLEHLYGEPIISIRKAIWDSSLTMKEKEELNEALVLKLKN